MSVVSTNDLLSEMIPILKNINDILGRAANPPVGDEPSADMAVNAIKQNDELRRENEVLRLELRAMTAARDGWKFRAVRAGYDGLDQ